MARRLHVLALAAALAASAAPAFAAHPATGGVGTGTGGGTASTAPAAAGGARYGTRIRGAGPEAPVARRFSVAPRVVRAPRLPRLALRIDQRGARTVRARLVFWPAGGGAAVERVDLGRVRTGRVVRPRLPRALTLQPGRYVVRVHVRGRGGTTLARAAATPGRARLVVLAPRPAPAPPPPPSPAAPAGEHVFPVRGAWSMPSGGGFGNDRGTHRHEGQDISATEGTPVVAPIGGTVRVVAHQPSAAGHYVVVDGTDGRSYFFAHLRTGSTVVTQGARVGTGAPLAQVGSTGRSSGPHLHFEIWVDGWRVSSASRPIDPLPELRAWAGR